MSHTQMFKKADNDDGYMSVIVHRDRYLKDLEAEGWVSTQQEALGQENSNDTDAERAALVEKAKSLGVERAGAKSNETLKSEIEAIENDNGSNDNK